MTILIDEAMSKKSVAAKYASGVEPWPFFAEEEIEAACDVLRSGRVNYWTGEQCRLFEAEYAAYTGSRHAIALANGTVALELALRTLGIGPGDEVITTPRTFIASASAIVAVGARPVFADVDRESQNISAETVLPVISRATKAIIAVHLAGWPCEMDGLLEVARAAGLYVIEDCAQAHGAMYRGRAVGSLGDIGAFSFCQDKIMTTAGEGGMMTLDSESQFKASWSYKDHGKGWDAVQESAGGPGFRWLHESFGTNWRLTEVQGAIGRIQLRKLDGWVRRRREHACLLKERLVTVRGLRLTQPPDHVCHAYYKYYAFLRPELLRIGWSRDRIVEAIRARQVPCFSGSCGEIYLEAAFPPDLRPRQRLPVAQELGETSLMFPVHPTLLPESMERTAKVVADVMAEATR